MMRAGEVPRGEKKIKLTESHYRRSPPLTRKACNGRGRLPSKKKYLGLEGP